LSKLPSGDGGADGERRAEPVVPTAEGSWDRHTRILDLIEQIRAARERRPELPNR